MWTGNETNTVRTHEWEWTSIEYSIVCMNGNETRIETSVVCMNGNETRIETSVVCMNGNEPVYLWNVFILFYFFSMK